MPRDVSRWSWTARNTSPITTPTAGTGGRTALRLAHFFGTSAEFWLNLQKLYELRLAEDKVGKAIRALPTLKDEPSHV